MAIEGYFCVESKKKTRAKVNNYEKFNVIQTRVDFMNSIQNGNVQIIPKSKVKPETSKVDIRNRFYLKWILFTNNYRQLQEC